MCLITCSSRTCQHISGRYILSVTLCPHIINDIFKLFHFTNHLFLALSLSSHHAAVSLFHVVTLFRL